jgi:hypothetical protein
VLTEPHYRAAAQRLQLEIAEQRDPVVVIAETLEDLVPSSEAEPPRVTVGAERRAPHPPLMTAGAGD